MVEEVVADVCAEVKKRGYREDSMLPKPWARDGWGRKPRDCSRQRISRRPEGVSITAAETRPFFDASGCRWPAGDESDNAGCRLIFTLLRMSTKSNSRDRDEEVEQIAERCDVEDTKRFDYRVTRLYWIGLRFRDWEMSAILLHGEESVYPLWDLLERFGVLGMRRKEGRGQLVGGVEGRRKREKMTLWCAVIRCLFEGGIRGREASS